MKHVDLDSSSSSALPLSSQTTLRHLTGTILQSSRIIVVAGAGISCASGIPVSPTILYRLLVTDQSSIGLSKSRRTVCALPIVDFIQHHRSRPLFRTLSHPTRHPSCLQHLYRQPLHVVCQSSTDTNSCLASCIGSSTQAQSSRRQEGTWRRKGTLAQSLYSKH